MSSFLYKWLDVYLIHGEYHRSVCCSIITSGMSLGWLTLIPQVHRGGSVKAMFV